ncbi:kinase-like domain-containing protein [Bombardia bombarda]|uniref:EKC/KEOPS complex subunit BUD32 n=1 Tax=Bombardia bombarda TaxID=252184 RepID=A0AA40C7S2_9PEZI|nr:kinase-like domain-containing protein [Bombardia bombarda]
MASIEHYGSTSMFYKIRPGVLLKSPFKPNIEGPHIEKFKERIRLAFSVEVPILERLGPHSRIVKYLGNNEQGILLGQASHGSLQAYLDAKNSSIDLNLRKKWCRQAAEAIAYIHSRGVLHSDIRPDNFLVHESKPGCFDLLLCDFGGAKCDDLRLDGKHLPDDPFYDPTQGTECTPALDVSSLGSMFYAILTGLWPYKPSPGPFVSTEEEADYEARVNRLFLQGRYPNVEGLVGGSVIMGCWKKQYQTANKVLEALDREMA